LKKPRLSKLELQIMETLWALGQASIREMREAFPEESRPAYTTVQTMVYRLETKGAVKRLEKVGNFHMFAPAISRVSVQKRMIDEFFAFLGGRSEPVMAHLIESGKLTLEDVRAAEKTLLALSENKGKSKEAKPREAKPRGARQP
jgi:BlaI family transcriptional regulator, penicillinase repressor